VLPALAASEAPVDLVFVDPPYAGGVAGRALAALAGSPLLAAGARVVVQHSVHTPLPLPAGLAPAREPRRFGDTALTFLAAER
jgi:16S rRNA (guanine966-N2)-methyltransferase